LFTVTRFTRFVRFARFVRFTPFVRFAQVTTSLLISFGISRPNCKSICDFLGLFVLICFIFVFFRKCFTKLRPTFLRTHSILYLHSPSSKFHENLPYLVLTINISLTRPLTT